MLPSRLYLVAQLSVFYPAIVAPSHEPSLYDHISKALTRDRNSRNVAAVNANVVV